MNRHLFCLATVFAVASVLSACGGGGGDSDSASSAGSATTEAATPVAAPAPAPAATPAQPAGTGLPATYPVGSEELAAFSFLNGERDRCGFGQLTQNTRLDAAAKAHADYQLLNNLFQHNEDQAAYPAGFTGATPWDRFAYQGYANMGGGVDLIAGLSGVADKAGFGVRGMRNLLNAPYHLKGLMAGMREMGVSVRSSTDTRTAQQRVILQYDGAHSQAAGAQDLAAADVLSYPCEGSAGVDRQLTNESPEPVPGRDLAANPLGTSVYVSVRFGNTLEIRSATMTHARTGAQVPLRAVITTANDPQKQFGGHEAYVAADAPLAANSSYQVTVTGTNNATAFSRTFVFSTGG